VSQDRLALQVPLVLPAKLGQLVLRGTLVLREQQDLPVLLDLLEQVEQLGLPAQWAQLA